MPESSTPAAPESICVSLEWAKKLKEAGWPQIAMFYWRQLGTDGHSILDTAENTEKFLSMDYFAAPTAEEILRRLPNVIRKDGWYYILEAAPTAATEWIVGYRDNHAAVECVVFKQFLQGSIANAAAAMYCYLAEHKLLPSP